MSMPYQDFESYRNAIFRVQSILLPNASNPANGEGKIYVEALTQPRTFRVPNFQPALSDIVLSDNLVCMPSGEYNPILGAVLSSITPDMYKRDVPSRAGMVPRRGNHGQFREWGEEFLARVRARGEYLALYVNLSINPSEWGQTPVKQTGEQTARRTVGNNITGHRLNRGDSHR